MARIFYSFALILISPLIVFYLYVLRGKKNKGYRAHFKERFGFVSKSLFTSKSKPLVVHCASVGEVLAAAPLIKALQKQHPQLNILITCNTPTGREQIINQFKNTVACSYLPMDFAFSTARFLKRINPQALCILETELWPNLMAISHKKNIPVLVLNARLSEKSQQGYQKVTKLTQIIMRSITVLASHNKKDAERFIELGLPPSKSHVTGSIKFDITPSDEQLTKVANLKFVYKTQERFVWVAGSTHPLEHEMILNAHQQLLKKYPNALLIIAPRHPEQFDKVADTLAQSPLSFSRRSNNNYQNEHVLLADTLGELQCLYGAGNVSYVGGSLIRRGGHNPLESAAFSVGVITGPYTYNFDHIYPELIKLKGAVVVENTDELATQLINLSQNTKACQTLGNKAQQCVLKNQGAIKKTLTIINQYLEP
ncbi:MULTISPECIES: lipid IV(A) 3-deoxy-D-manno-octulosonic acid transferase [unclassified Pseudoalteromonas]|uniref:lipid IV(A) 3-deoxy-D-manno-octulosonic acid transferase n=1 Tax=unclassified Pseudoalteromonas TaxID=194690 RepID=UPI0011080236|nr:MULTISPECIES: lipid IV(A) 3-deoxy-D-manno-octulosonic acid transferase [unclassified Pseudoalteromonas]MBW4967477.1 lipid IV(A) 3-deoxy-D-manno-octulosonic acid transferase [Pseudoalteromonas sp. CR1]TMN80526.1 3-deoxy-D-manno-octulosonic acid transferase [Pseudoalteromonas sp. S410]TMN89889.1 3-deoxy-D-manno-octulosonic acid transferase [Pseudoalteromonas sp. S408]TMN97643.1 3-deoxy-D-manno-octulosonic acid transferase [Pseudoalteromonas sp. S407]TMO02114.1 3-deoxy-D-manno-octulosonic acid|tara:strand:- start:281 stop:1558 length:1278 start_codon:yes stop_codon:yes gene_type:complete